MDHCLQAVLLPWLWLKQHCGNFYGSNNIQMHSRSSDLPPHVNCRCCGWSQTRVVHQLSWRAPPHAYISVSVWFHCWKQPIELFKKTWWDTPETNWLLCNIIYSFMEHCHSYSLRYIKMQMKYIANLSGKLAHTQKNMLKNAWHFRHIGADKQANQSSHDTIW